MRRLFDGVVTVLRQFREIVDAKMQCAEPFSPAPKRIQRFRSRVHFYHIVSPNAGKTGITLQLQIQFVVFFLRSSALNCNFTDGICEPT